MDVITELQQQRESLKQNIHDMDESIKKLTGRDPAESRRLSTTKRIQLKRNSFGLAGDNQPNKRASTEKRRWGNTALTRANNLDSGGEEQEEKKPAVQSSVVVTGKPIESPRPPSEDNATKTRNKRMFGLLMGTLKQFKRDSQVKTEQDAKREEKLIKVEEQVQKDKEDAVVERRELFQTRRGKQQELRNIEFKIEMAELNEELKSYYDQIKDFIQLKSTPRIFYRPAEHNEKTSKLLKESQDAFKESLHQRMREIAMCTEEDLISNGRIFRRNRPFPGGKSAKDPIIIDQAPSKRDLFAEDADIDQQERVEVIVDQDTVEPASAADKDLVEEMSVDVVESVKADEIVEVIDSKVNENDKELGAVIDASDLHEHVPVPVGLVTDAQGHSDLGKHVDEDDSVDKSVQGSAVVDESVQGNDNIDGLVQDKGVVDEHGKECTDVDEQIKGQVNTDEHVKVHIDDDKHVERHSDIEDHSQKHADTTEHVMACDDDLNEYVMKNAEVDVQGCSDIDRHVQEHGESSEQEHTNIFEQLQESSNHENMIAETNDDLSTKIDDSFLHDEYAAQLLEQVVDEGRVVSGNSYNVVDERVTNLNNKSSTIHTMNYVDAKTEGDNTVLTNTNTTEEQLQKGNEMSHEEDL